MPQQGEGSIKIALAQMNPCVGAIEANAAEIIKTIQLAQSHWQADVVVFPELVLTGYPPQDLLLRPELYTRVQQSVLAIAKQCQNITAVLGLPLLDQEQRYNSVVVLNQGKTIANYAKQCLPNYSVFDELRYFTSGCEPCIISVKGAKLGVIICEDGWYSAPAKQAKRAGADILLQLNASPYYLGKPELRKEMVALRARETDMPIVSVYQVGGQDEIIFDGNSFVCNQDGEVVQELPQFSEALAIASFNQIGHVWQPEASVLPVAMSAEAEMYQALVLGVKDYINKNGFPGAILGLSGGIDSALTLAIAVDALGKDSVEAVLMPSRYTSELSNREALQQIEWLGVKHHTIAIEPIMQSFLQALAPSFGNTAADLTEENLQARCRGVLLMALSNKHGKLVLTTSNKSEVAVGYSTLYGDMAGGFAVLKDVWKTWVYRLARYRNTISPAIPELVITRAPSAELRDNQTDQDSLPEYAILDAIMQRYVEDNQSAEQIINAGFAADAVQQAIHLLKRSQYKRQQGPIGPKVTKRGFGADWRYPLTAKF